jgi:hypothetical protein
VQLVGFGPGGPASPPFPVKRQALFAINSYGAGNVRFNMPRTGAGTADDPTRVATGGDSGGPYTLTGGANAGQVVGVQSAASATAQTAANIAHPLLYNWIDSYTQRTIFWDRLTIGTNTNGNLNPTKDGFDSRAVTGNAASYGYGLDGLAAGWSYVAAGTVNDPGLGRNGVATTSFRYYDAIGRMNDGRTPELYFDGDSSQAETITPAGLATTGLSIIQKNFTVMGGQMLTVSVLQRWNSLYLGDDMGVRLPNGQIVWNGASISAANTLDQFFRRDQRIDLTAFPGEQTITVYLSNAGVPEPSTVGLLVSATAFGGVVFWCRRRRSKRLQRQSAAA